MRFKYKKMIITASCSIMLLGMVIFSTKTPLDTRAEGKAVTAKDNNIKDNDTKDNTVDNNTTLVVSNSSAEVKENKDSANNTSSAAETKSSENVASEEGGDETASDNAKGVSILMKNAYPEVNKLVAEYFKARVAVDKDKISQLVDNVNYAGFEELGLMMKNIENIRLTDCYTIDGPEDKAMMVYARNEIKFKGIDTAASSLDGFYVRTDDNGDIKIVLSTLPDEVQKIIDEDTKREDVAALISDVNTKFAREIKSDKKLAEFFAKLQNRQAGSKENIEVSEEKDKSNDKDVNKKQNKDKSSKENKKTKDKKES